MLKLTIWFHENFKTKNLVLTGNFKGKLQLSQLDMKTLIDPWSDFNKILEND